MVAGLDCETKLGVLVVPEAGAPVVLGPEPDVAVVPEPGAAVVPEPGAAVVPEPGAAVVPEPGAAVVLEVEPGDVVVPGTEAEEDEPETAGVVTAEPEDVVVTGPLPEVVELAGVLVVPGPAVAVVVDAVPGVVAAEFSSDCRNAGTNP